jgi:glycosyltransferase involved in cell wall biosynthesis
MISIITVVFNGESTIRDTMDSVCKQTYLPTEYIIIDGLSTDNTVRIVEEYIKLYPFIKLVSEKDNGIYDAMNKGIKLASGDLIGIINSDDWYEPNAFADMAQSYSVNGSGVYYGILRYLLDNDEFYLERVNQKFIAQKMIQHPTTFISRDVYEEHGYFDLKYHYSSDLDLIVRLIKSKVPFFHLDSIIANFRIGGASSTPKAGIESLLIRKSYGLIGFKTFIIKFMKLKIKTLFN